MLPQYIAAIERETGALIYRVSFACRDGAQLATRAARHVLECELLATLERRAVTYRLFETRDATLGEIEASFARMQKAGAIDGETYARKVATWRARLEA